MDIVQSASRQPARKTSAPVENGPAGPGIKPAPAVQGRYNRLIDAANRLPRPALMALTIGLFAYATLDPAGFAARMRALEQIPEPMWWLQGAVVTYYFGAREAHYLRQRPQGKAEGPKAAAPQGKA